jgi:hypothetical protein
MAQSLQTGNPIVTAENPITDLLSTPLGPEWTVERLAEEVLSTIAANALDEVQEFVLDGETIMDRQSRRLLRPLLACLATKSAAESGSSTNLYGGRISFKRPGQNGPVWIFGDFENTPGTARIAFHRSASPPRISETSPGEKCVSLKKPRQA